MADTFLVEWGASKDAAQIWTRHQLAMHAAHWSEDLLSWTTSVLRVAERKEPHLAGAKLILPGLECGRHKLGGDDYEEQLCMLHHLGCVSRGPHAFRAPVALQTGHMSFGDSLYGATDFVKTRQVLLGWARWRSS